MNNYKKYEGPVSTSMKPEEALLYVGRIPAKCRINHDDEILYDKFEEYVKIDGIRYELMTVKDDVIDDDDYKLYGIDIVLAVDCFEGSEYAKKLAARMVVGEYREWIKGTLN